jgi:hypothetical protein
MLSTVKATLVFTSSLVAPSAAAPPSSPSTVVVSAVASEFTSLAIMDGGSAGTPLIPYHRRYRTGEGVSVWRLGYGVACLVRGGDDVLPLQDRDHQVLWSRRELSGGGGGCRRGGSAAPCAAPGRCRSRTPPSLVPGQRRATCALGTQWRGTQDRCGSSPTAALGAHDDAAQLVWRCSRRR